MCTYERHTQGRHEPRDIKRNADGTGVHKGINKQYTVTEVKVNELWYKLQREGMSNKAEHKKQRSQRNTDIMVSSFP